MADPLPQYHRNDLGLIAIEEEALHDALRTFRSAMRVGIAFILSEIPDPDSAKEAMYGTIFSGSLGVAFAFIRLFNQGSHLVLEGDDPLPDLIAAAELRVDPNVHELDLQPGRPSPLESRALGASLLRILLGKRRDEDGKMLLVATEFALQQPSNVEFRGHTMGVDEVLYGRTGLLWGILETWKIRHNQEDRTALAPVYQMIHRLVDTIIDAGREGAKNHAAKSGSEPPMPLMWSWIDHDPSLGVMHGITGILSVLLDVNLRPHCLSIVKAYPEIAATITGLCEVCNQNGGHLPTSIPPRPSKRDSPLVQICHGTPGLLLLLACAKRNTTFAKEHWSSIWDEAIRVGSETVWREGLLSKGGSLCHGIAGNAFPLLMLCDPTENRDNYLLSAALAMLLATQETEPFAVLSGMSDSRKTGRKYRMPDHPYSLFEGLAGTLCAWAEACIVIEMKLRQISLKKAGASDDDILSDKEIRVARTHQLGFPGIGW